VWEGAVERRGRHHRDALRPAGQLVEVEPEQALTESGRQRLSHLGRDLGRGTLDGDPVDRERGRGARGGIEAEPGEQDQDRDEE